MSFTTEEKTVAVVHSFTWYVVVPAILLGFVISVVSPGSRMTISSILGNGLIAFVALLIIYCTVEYIRNRRK